MRKKPSSDSYESIRASLAADLKAAIRGEVRFDQGSRALYATDASNYRQVPIGVVIPKDTDDVVAAMKLARKYSAPVLSRGAGTSLAGQCCNVAVVIDMSKYLNTIRSVHRDLREAEVEPGVVLDRLREEAERYDLTFGPDPATHNRCTLGGMIGNNSCGVHSVYSGKTDNNVEELEILTYAGLRMRVGKASEEELQQIISKNDERGRIYAALKSIRDDFSDLIRNRYPNIPRCISGYNLPQLLPENGFHVARALVGSEGTCVTVLSAKLRLVQSPRYRVLCVLGFHDIAAAGDAVPQILQYRPLGLEGIDDWLVNAIRRKGQLVPNLRLLPEGSGWLLVEFGADTENEAASRGNDLLNGLRSNPVVASMKMFESVSDQTHIWKIRESALGVTSFVPNEPDTWEGWEDAAVRPDKVGQYLRDFKQLLKKYEYTGPLYGHFGDGCIHTRMNFDLCTEPGITKYRAFVEEASDLVLQHGGSLSGEHGDGQSRGELLPKMFGPELIQAFERFKAVWDPHNKMNPGKLVHPYRITENLRLGTGYNPAKIDTLFLFPKDGRSFARAALRCVGVGECRKTEAGLMCPSYMVTLEEQHSTRGRAHLLFEMLNGDVIGLDKHEDAVKEALDLCLACKGCKHDCPVEVDMATYKAEFFHHYYKKHRRPRSALAMSFIDRWARLASHLPGIANFFAHVSPFSAVAKKLTGISPKRQLPAFAKESFTTWFRRNRKPSQDGPAVILWPDTFNNYFHPQSAIAAVQVLEAAGYHVKIPKNVLCCGRPLYDFGYLPEAKAYLRKVLDHLRKDMDAGIPLVGLEPSCVAVFRDELLNLFANDQDAERLSKQTYLFSEFLQYKAAEWNIPKLSKKAVVHFHCHHVAVLGIDTEKDLLSRLGIDYRALDSGCCGMAGSFGFDQNHYEISMQCGERVLLPSVRKAEHDTLIVTNGFSCRGQIEHGASRTALHIAEVVQMALQQENH